MSRALRSLCSLWMVAGLQACSSTSSPGRYELATFRVTVQSLSEGGSTQPLPVVNACLALHGGAPENVPAQVRGTVECPYAIPSRSIEAVVGIEALGHDGNVLSDFDGPVSFRVVPGVLTGNYLQRTARLSAGVGVGTVRATGVYSEVRIWVEDAPTPLIASEGQVGGDLQNLPPEPEVRTYATGLSAPLFFDEPTLAKAQHAGGGRFDNTGSPFQGQYLTIGRAPGDERPPVVQNCPEDSERDRQPVTLVVTGLDQGGFYITDLTACRQKERLNDGSTEVAVPEPSTFYPGTFGSMYVYNNSYPEGLYPGDLLWSVAGSLQEFTSTTQLTFPSWVVREHARDAPQEQWLRHLAGLQPVDINLRLCGAGDSFAPSLTDALCGHDRSNLKMESLESGLVRLRRLRVPEVIARCDSNGDARLPLFCNATPCSASDSQECREQVWRDCGSRTDWNPADPRNTELVCNIDCVVGQGSFAGKRCSERSNLSSFGQFIAELAGPGPAELHYDDALPKRIRAVTLAAGATTVPEALPPGQAVRLWCDVPVRYRWAEGATAEDTELLPGTLVEHFLAEGETSVSFFRAEGGGTCRVAINPRTKINLVTRDTIPQLEPDCSTDAAAVGEARARECLSFRSATYDVVGHLRHVQAGRPRWVVTPRDASDVCCYPGEGLECPKPIQACR